MSYCPKCGAEVQDDDAFCRACGTPLHDPSPEPAERERSRGSGCFSSILILVGAIALAGIVFALVSNAGSGGSTSNSSTPNTLERANIEVNCEDLVKKHLVSPGTMKVPSNNGAQRLSDGSWVYNFAVDSENGFGALLRTNWHCEVHGNQVTVQQTK